MIHFDYCLSDTDLRLTVVLESESLFACFVHKFLIDCFGWDQVGFCKILVCGSSALVPLHCAFPKFCEWKD